MLQNYINETNILNTFPKIKIIRISKIRIWEVR